ncbi:MAG: YidC/Oxa1 family membrane protein insertase [bacterium]
MDFTNITVGILNTISNFSGGFGVAIILLTVIIRMVMWPLSVQQQRSMKKMQTLSPKMKDLQARYKNNPQVMQQKMMEFYKENEFNPMGGCLPMLLQLPVFILLYSALMSPQFMQVAGDSSFLFINRLDQTLKSSDAIPQDGKFSVNQKDSFSTDKKAIITMKDGTTEEIKIPKPSQAVQIQGTLTPGEPVDLKISLDDLNLKFSELDKIKSAKISIVNNATREFETINFARQGSILTATEPTFPTKSSFNYDIFALVMLFGVTMYLSQKVLMKANAQADLDPAQAAMQKTMSQMMPLMVIGMFIFIPIPAGVLLYLVTSNVIQVLQTLVIDKQLANEKPKIKNGVIEAEIINKDN